MGCGKPGLNTRPHFSSTPGRCAPPEAAWTWTSAKPLQAPNRQDTLMRSTPGGRRARRGRSSSFFQLWFTARSADAAAALTACCQTEPPPLLQTHCQIQTAFALWAVNTTSCGGGGGGGGGALTRSHYDCTSAHLSPGGNDKGRGPVRNLHSSSAVPAGVSRSDTDCASRTKIQSLDVPAAVGASRASVTLRKCVLRRASGTANGLWLRQEVRGFQRSSVWEASLGVRTGMRGAAAGCCE